MSHPIKRFLFSVDVTATGRLIYSVVAPDEVAAFEQLKSGDKNCMLVYEDMVVQSMSPPAIPVFLCVDPQYQRSRPND